MKTFTQFNEDLNRLQQRRNALRKRQLSQIEANKQRVAAYQQSRQEDLQKQIERKQLKQELKRELQTEQVPTMVNATHPPNPYNVAIAKQQATRKRQEAAHAQNEIQQSAVRQQIAKNRRLKAIMSR